jgi:P2-related tail formation protein
MTIHRQKGTAKSVKDVVAAFGGAILLREWWQKTPMGEPHTFDLVMTLSGAGGQSATAAFVDDVIAEVSRTKPVRSHFTFTQGVETHAAIAVAVVARPVIYARLNLTEA